MHQPWDQLCKEVLGAMFGALGRVEREREVASRVQRVDLWVEPDMRAVRTRRAAYFELFARMAEQGPLMLEVFSRAPQVAAVEACVREQLVLGDELSREAGREGRARPQKPRLWIVSSGRPRQVLEAFEAQPMAGWPAGFYTQRAQEAMYFVVVNELPETPQTLVLRLAGRGATLARAGREVWALAAGDAWIREWIQPSLVAFLGWIGQHSHEAEVMNVPREFRQLYQDWERRVREEGAAEGRTEGRAESLLAVLEARGWTIPSDVTGRVRACHDADQLETWLRRAATAGSLADVFADH